MRISGWYRLWIVAAVLWAVLVALRTLSLLITLPSGTEDTVLVAAAMEWIGGSALLLGIGYGVAWARRGFRTH